VDPSGSKGERGKRGGELRDFLIVDERRRLEKGRKNKASNKALFNQKRKGEEGMADIPNNISHKAEKEEEGGGSVGEGKAHGHVYRDKEEKKKEREGRG